MNDVLMGSVNEIFSAVLVGLAMYVSVLVRGFVKARVDAYRDQIGQAAADRIEKAMNNAIDAGLAAAGKATVTDVIGYVARMNPGDLDLLKLGGQKLRDRASTAIAKRVADKTQEAATTVVNDALKEAVQGVLKK